MKAYKYNKDTKHLIGEVQCAISPAESKLVDVVREIIEYDDDGNEIADDERETYTVRKVQLKYLLPPNATFIKPLEVLPDNMSMIFNEEAQEWEIADPIVDIKSALTAWWDSLTPLGKTLIYEHAPNAILAWERGEFEVLISLILANDAPEIADLKTQVQQLIS